jgi:hypothetical protein
LYAAVFGHSFANDPALSGIMKAFNRLRPAKQPYTELRWHIAQLLAHFVRLGPNNSLLQYHVLLGKFICLCMILAGMRMAEIRRINVWTVTITGEYAQFYVRIKSKPALAPIRLPRVPQQPSIDPVLVLLDIKRRLEFVEPKSEWAGRPPAANAAGVRAPASFPCALPENQAARTGIVGPRMTRSASPDDVAQAAMISSGLCDEHGTPYTDPHIRALAKKTLSDAGIDETRPYHIKHATVSFLYGLRMPPEKIAMFLRQKVDSFTFFKHYVSNDLGRQCAASIVSDFIKACPFGSWLFVCVLCDTLHSHTIDNAYTAHRALSQ